VGYKTFVAGEEALAADVNAYLMAQTVARFPSAAARSSALAAPALNQLSELDTRPGVVQFWTGAAWADVGQNVTYGGFLQVTTNAFGGITLTFPTALPAVPNYVGIQDVATVASTPGVSYSVMSGTVTAANVVLYAWRGSTLLINTQVQFLWSALVIRA
jgi:hypothetical protein